MCFILCTFGHIFFSSFPFFFQFFKYSPTSCWLIRFFFPPPPLALCLTVSSLWATFNSSCFCMCFCQVVTSPLPPLAVPPQCPTAMIPWRGATIQVCFHCRRVFISVRPTSGAFIKFLQRCRNLMRGHAASRCRRHHRYEEARDATRSRQNNQ